MSRSLKQVSKELVSHPFFPLLFLGKGVETAAFALIGSATVEEAVLMIALGVAATIIWALSDSLSVEFDKEGFVGK